MPHPDHAMEIVSSAAITPEFQTIQALWAAWCTGSRPEVMGVESRNSMDWHGLVAEALHPILTHVRDASHCGVILATAKGNISEIEAWMAALRQGSRIDPVPELMSDSLQAVTHQFGFGGPCYVLSTACTSGLTALIEAGELLAGGVVSEVVVVAAETITDFTHSGFQALKALTKTTCRPFDKSRDGLALGSAAAACLLRRIEPWPRSEGTVSLVGWGMAADAVHRTAPDRTAGGLIRAIRSALAMAGLGPEAIDVVAVHGTGTRYNDQMEATALRALFSHQPAITGIKGLIGHTLGAAGLIETLLAGRCLITGLVPPMVGLQQSEYPDLNLVIQSGPVRPLKYLLKTASGFGGLNAAVILSQTVPA